LAPHSAETRQNAPAAISESPRGIAGSDDGRLVCKKQNAVQSRRIKKVGHICRKA
jgi:hypothetical protein